MELLTSKPRQPATTRASTDGRADALVAEGLTKRYGDRVAVDGVSFSVPAGSVAGLIGPNGAGKTTIMAMLLGLVRPSAGTASVLGAPIDRPQDYLGRVGALIEGPAFHPAVSGIENLRSLAVLGGQDPSGMDELIERVGLEGRGGDRYGAYSLGMKQRLGIAAALIGEPELVVLDEPTNGLDPVGMQEVRALIRSMAVGGRTVLVSSHLLGELEQVCDWLIVVDRGGLVHLGPPASLGGVDDVLVLSTADGAGLELLARLVNETGQVARIDGRSVIVELIDVSDAGGLAADLNQRAHRAGIALSELRVERADLEARYLNLTAGRVRRRPTPGGDDTVGGP